MNAITVKSLDRADVLRPDRRHRLADGDGEGDGVLPMLGEAARHHADPRPHRVDVRAPDNPNARKCRDLEAARDGVRGVVSLMDPKLDRVGLAVTPPATGPRAGQGDSPDDACAKPTSGNNYYGFDAWAPWWKTEFEQLPEPGSRVLCRLVDSPTTTSTTTRPTTTSSRTRHRGTGISTPRRPRLEARLHEGGKEHQLRRRDRRGRARARAAWPPGRAGRDRVLHRRRRQHDARRRRALER